MKPTVYYYQARHWIDQFHLHRICVEVLDVDVARPTYSDAVQHAEAACREVIHSRRKRGLKVPEGAGGWVNEPCIRVTA